MYLENGLEMKMTVKRIQMIDNGFSVVHWTFVIIAVYTVYIIIIIMYCT